MSRLHRLVAFRPVQDAKPSDTSRSGHPRCGTPRVDDRENQT